MMGERQVRKRAVNLLVETDPLQDDELPKQPAG